jgi:hypothetical protein
MQNHTSVFVLAAKLVLATVLLLGLLSVAAADLAPQVPLAEFLWYAAIGGLGLVAIVIAGAVVSLTVSQFVLRQGGTDAQWFWFRSEPQGLVQLRAQAKALAAQQGQEPS